MIGLIPQKNLGTLDSTNPCRFEGDYQRRASASVHAEARVRESEGRRESMGQDPETSHHGYGGRNLGCDHGYQFENRVSRSRWEETFCVDRRLEPVQLGMKGGGGGSDSDMFPDAFYLTDQEIVDYYWMVVFLPSLIVFALSIGYLVAGITVAYSAPTRHGCLKVVENNYCASRRGGVRCLSILNLIFAIIFGLLALFLGSSLLTLVSNCSAPLFWCYEIASWGLVLLYAGTAFFLRRKAALILDEGSYSGQNLGVEMLEANPLEVTPEMERHVNEGFKAWMGSSLLSSDEDEPDSYEEAPHLAHTNSNSQRL